MSDWDEVGASFERVLRELTRSEIWAMFPDGLLEALESLDPTVKSDSGLINAAAQILDLREVVANPAHRDRILRALPQNKRRELEDRAAIPPGGLFEAEWDGDRVRALVGFLGGTLDGIRAADPIPEFQMFRPYMVSFPTSAKPLQACRRSLKIATQCCRECCSTCRLVRARHGRDLTLLPGTSETRSRLA